MFKNILIAEDLDSIVNGIATALEDSEFTDKIITTQYCDEAHLKFLKAIQDGNPFDLLITDLSFKADHRISTINSGEELIAAIRTKTPHIPIIAYSVEDRPSKIKYLFEKYHINGYVVKGRNGLKNMLEALKTIYNKRTYVSPELVPDLNKKEVFELDDYDILLLWHLSKGLTQDQISNLFKDEKISPCSVSSIEKRLNRLKLQLQAKTTIQLVANAKDMGLI
jgi:DNA-binding NarL/FixJ family response regulator